MTQWEYKVMPMDPTNDHATQLLLTQLGKDGWELVDVTERPRSGMVTAYLKRPVVPKKLKVFKPRPGSYLKGNPDA